MSAGIRASLITGLILSGCTSVPTGPSVLVLPGAHQSFANFSRDDGFCRQHALAQVGGTTPQASAAQTGIGAAAVGTSVGAASGAALGGGYGAAVGAGAGLIGGSAVGTGMGYQSSRATQQRYDWAYIQCMYGHGHQVPIQGLISNPSGENARATSGVANRAGIPLPPENPSGSLSSGQPNPQTIQGTLPLPPR